ncbi:kinase-like domain-containing protein [Hypomontagnella monticulosa]|nr:kinase-like domain-containing protein [Hypomontagnella monticulosa]
MAPPLLPSDGELVSIAQEWYDARVKAYNSNQCQDLPGPWSGFAYPPSEPIVWIKMKGSLGEARMQTLAYDYLSGMDPSMRRNVRVPEVYRTIEWDGKIYIVMEYVNGKSLMEDVVIDDTVYDSLMDQLAYAIQLLLSFPVSADTPPGPAGGGQIRHTIFKDQEASIDYNSVEEIERHFNNIIESKGDQRTIRFSGERMCFCFSDIHEANVIFTNMDNGYVYIIDFEHAAFLPISFMAYVLNWADSWILLNLRRRITLQPGEMEGNANLVPLSRVKYIYTFCNLAIGLSFDEELGWHIS